MKRQFWLTVSSHTVKLDEKHRYHQPSRIQSKHIKTIPNPPAGTQIHMFSCSYVSLPSRKLKHVESSQNTNIIMVLLVITYHIITYNFLQGTKKNVNNTCPVCQATEGSISQALGQVRQALWCTPGTQPWKSHGLGGAKTVASPMAGGFHGKSYLCMIMYV